MTYDPAVIDAARRASEEAARRDPRGDPRGQAAREEARRPDLRDEAPRAGPMPPRDDRKNGGDPRYDDRDRPRRDAYDGTTYGNKSSQEKRQGNSGGGSA